MVNVRIYVTYKESVFDPQGIRSRMRFMLLDMMK